MLFCFFAFPSAISLALKIQSAVSDHKFSIYRVLFSALSLHNRSLLEFYNYSLRCFRSFRRLLPLGL